jgi:GDPmannose 4,6-dehydratase
VEAMWLILQQEKPEDYVIATGITTTIREFIRMAFAELGITLAFEGTGVDEKALVAACANPDFQLPIGKVVVEVDPAYFRPTEVELLIGDPSKAMKQLNWKPNYDLHALVKEMVWADVELFQNNRDTYTPVYE